MSAKCKYFPRMGNTPHLWLFKRGILYMLQSHRSIYRLLAFISGWYYQTKISFYFQVHYYSCNIYLKWQSQAFEFEGVGQGLILGTKIPKMAKFLTVCTVKITFICSHYFHNWVKNISCAQHMESPEVSECVIPLILASRNVWERK